MRTAMVFSRVLFFIFVFELHFDHVFNRNIAHTTWLRKFESYFDIYCKYPKLSLRGGFYKGTPDPRKYSDVPLNECERDEEKFKNAIFALINGRDELSELEETEACQVVEDSGNFRDLPGSGQLTIAGMQRQTNVCTHALHCGERKPTELRRESRWGGQSSRQRAPRERRARARQARPTTATPTSCGCPPPPQPGQMRAAIKAAAPWTWCRSTARARAHARTRTRTRPQARTSAHRCARQ